MYRYLENDNLVVTGTVYPWFGGSGRSSCTPNLSVSTAVSIKKRNGALNAELCAGAILTAKAVRFTAEFRANEPGTYLRLHADLAEMILF